MRTHTCVCCGKKMYSGQWTTAMMPGAVMRFGEFILKESLFFNSDSEKIPYLCGGCRRRCIAILSNPKTNLRQFAHQEIACGICQTKFRTTNDSAGAITLVPIGKYYVCEKCLRGERQTDNAETTKIESNAAG